MLEERIAVVMLGDLASLDLLVGLSLHALPAFRPEPGLFGRHRHSWVKLDHPVISLDDGDLSTGRVESSPSA